MRFSFLQAMGLAASFVPGLAVGLTMKDGTAWPSPEIPVCWENPKRAHAQERSLVRKAISWTWEKESAISFTGWRACGDNSRGIRISLESSYPRTLGRGVEIDGTAGGLILPSLWSLAALSVNLKAPVHEFGHALGFGHEHARLDAPDPERCGTKDQNGRRYTESDTPLTPFDEDSIMVACIAEATRNFSLGTPVLSASDIFGLVQVYGSHPDNVLGRDKTGDMFGSALRADDFDADGVTDLAVAAPGKENGAGAVFLFKGDPKRGFRPWERLSSADLTTSRWSGLRALFNPSETDGADFVLNPRTKAPFPLLANGKGRGAVILEIDLNEDGVMDRVIGAPHADGQSPASGIVIVLRGQSLADGNTRFLPWYWFGQAY